MNRAGTGDSAWCHRQRGERRNICVLSVRPRCPSLLRSGIDVTVSETFSSSLSLPRIWDSGVVHLDESLTTDLPVRYARMYVAATANSTSYLNVAAYISNL